MKTKHLQTSHRLPLTSECYKRKDDNMLVLWLMPHGGVPHKSEQSHIAGSLLGANLPISPVKLLIIRKMLFRESANGGMQRRILKADLGNIGAAIRNEKRLNLSAGAFAPQNIFARF